MKKIFISIVAIAALAACSKSEVQYDAPQEIGFTAVAGNITKSVVDGTTYPVTLNMYVSAWTTDFAPAADAVDKAPNYIEDGEFTHVKDNAGVSLWGGGSDNTDSGRHPYYWPNTKNLHFAGCSKSGNVTPNSIAYDCYTSTLSITDYNPGTGLDDNDDLVEGGNDLMFFPSTKLTKDNGYGKANGKDGSGNPIPNDPYVTVNMYHTCSWITFIVKGDEVTGGNYTVNSVTMTDIDKVADVSCSATVSEGNIVPNIVWDKNKDKGESYEIVKGASIQLSEKDAKDVETGSVYDATSAYKNIVVIPQLPGKLSLTYSYKSPTGDLIEESVVGLDLSLAKKNPDDTTSGPTEWLPGKHYIYTITIKANEILIAPQIPVDWDTENWGVTVE